MHADEEERDEDEEAESEREVVVQSFSKRHLQREFVCSSRYQFRKCSTLEPSWFRGRRGSGRLQQQCRQ